MADMNGTAPSERDGSKEDEHSQQTSSSSKVATPSSSNANFDDTTKSTTDGPVGDSPAAKAMEKKDTSRRRHKSSKKALKKVHGAETDSSEDSTSDSADEDSSSDSSDDNDRRRSKKSKKSTKSRKSGHKDKSSSKDKDKSKKKMKKKSQISGKTKSKKSASKSKHKHDDSDSDSDDSDSNSSDSSSASASSSNEAETSSDKKRGRGRRGESDDYDGEGDEAAEIDELDIPPPSLPRRSRGSGYGRYRGASGGYGGVGGGYGGGAMNPALLDLLGSHLGGMDDRRRRNARDKKKKSAKPASKMQYKRVDQIWDKNIYNYKLKESQKEDDDPFGQYIFLIRRRFNFDNEYLYTQVDIKSKLLKEALQEVMKDVKMVSLSEDKPSLDPNHLFLYLEELRTFAKKTLKTRIKNAKKGKKEKRFKKQQKHVKVLIKYLDKDYEETKKTLYPMLEAGDITFDLLWALFKPNTLAFTTTYGAAEHPRCFKVDYATKNSSFIKGDWYTIEGRYLEYDGKTYGLGEFEVDVDGFKGPRKITSLSCYPLEYHKEPEEVKKQLTERGKKFVSMEGLNYKFHNGLAFHKKKKQVIKVNCNGRIIIDPKTFRRINPNYPISSIKKDDPDAYYPSSDEDGDGCSCCGSDTDEEAEDGGDGAHEEKKEEEKERVKWKIMVDKDDEVHVVEVPVDEDGNELKVEKLEQLSNGESSGSRDSTSPKQTFTEEELMIASPVVLGFAFSEKLWLEFSIAGVGPIQWNEGAFDSLVLPPNQKSIVRALVESHKYDAAKTIDDVVQNKGRGLVSVLHGPPGTGKTLTAEGIAELLKCPLYMVSAGELGTDSRVLEQRLQEILDIAHSWGAVLLLDEADVFLEKRQIHDIHRNALVSIFLRLLEYFQGILFLTTNRVETFDDAFQSRIHVALRYGELTPNAKKTVWKTFLDKVKQMEDVKTVEWTDEEMNMLSRRDMNGRQIKNAVRTAQALAVNEKTVMSMTHIKRVLEVSENFDRDLKGGSGYMDAMRSYT